MPPPVTRSCGPRRTAPGSSCCPSWSTAATSSTARTRQATWPAGAPPAGERSILVVNVQAAAYVNGVFVALADRCGTERGVAWTGGSVIVGLDGYPLAGPPPGDRPALLVADCDLGRARSKAVGPRNDIHADRRADLYR